MQRKLFVPRAQQSIIGKTRRNNLKKGRREDFSGLKQDFAVCPHFSNQI